VRPNTRCTRRPAANRERPLVNAGRWDDRSIALVVKNGSWHIQFREAAMRIAVVWVCVLLVGCQARQSRQPILTDADAGKIRNAYQAFTAAATTDEFGHLGRFFTEDAVWMPHAGPAVQGRSAIEAWFTVRATDFKHQVLDVQGRDDLAYTRASFALSLDISGFTPCNGKALAIWKRQPGGEWLIANYAQTFDNACSGTQ
jgi:ketosteroid isomerase-like protein